MTAFSRNGLLAGWETRAVDTFLFLRDRVAAPEITLVVIDDDAFQALGQRQPLSRRYVADLADFLLTSGARVVAFDLVLTAPTVPAEDQALLATVARWSAARPGSLLFATFAMPADPDGAGGYTLLPPFAPELAGLLGFANAPIGADGMVRRFTPVLPRAGGGWLPALSLTTLAASGGLPPAELAKRLAGDGDAIPLPLREESGALAGPADTPVSQLAARSWRIDFTGPAGAFTTFPSEPLVQLARAGTIPDQDNPFRDRIVLVGATFAESRDHFPTPTGLMAGVEIHAHMVNTLLSRRALLPPPWYLNVALLTLVCVSISVLSLWLRPLWLALVGLALVAGLVAASYEAYTRGGYWLDFLAPLIGMLVYLHGAHVLRRRRLRSAFGQYVSPEIMDRVLQTGTPLGGEVRRVTVMSDLRGFTTMAERLAPQIVSEMMNEYFTAMVDVILAHRGLVQDFIGDAIMAVYGAPLDDPEHCWHAAHTAVAMHAALEGLNRRWEAQDRGPLAMGIAVHTGEAFAGTLGAPRKKKYAVLGDTVTPPPHGGVESRPRHRHPDQRRSAGGPEGPGGGPGPG